MKTDKITVKITVRWWWRWLYQPSLVFICRTMRLINPDIEPNPDKIAKWAKHAIKAQTTGEKE